VSGGCGAVARRLICAQVTGRPDPSRRPQEGEGEALSRACGRSKKALLHLLVLLVLASTANVTSGVEPKSKSKSKSKSKPAAACPEPAPEVGEGPALTMTPAVACISIAGYEDYEILPDTSLTSEEKLLVYYRPLNYAVKKDGSTYRIHLVQDGQVRRRDEEAVLMAKPKILDYEWKGKEPPSLQVYLRNTIGLKGLKPGEYDYVITLHDLLEPGEPVVRQTLAFTVVPPGPRNEAGRGERSGDRSTSP
jgi:hypothetical protein